MNVIHVSIEKLELFLYVLTRCSGIFVFTPFLGSVSIPFPARIVLSFMISYLISFTSPLIALPSPLTIGSLVIGLAGELLVGMVIGFTAHLVLAGLQYSGHLIGFQIGLSFVNAVDPGTSNRSTTLSILQNFLGLMLFLGFNGHHWFIDAVAKSWEFLPPYGMQISGPFLTRLTAIFGSIFVIGFQVAAPVLAVLILTDLGLGMVGRTAPQIHILVIGFPLKVLVGLSSLGLILFFLPTAMRGFSTRLYHNMYEVLHLLAR